MKKVLVTILTLCLVFAGILFSGCGVSDISLTGGPAYEDVIYGNGSMVVTKGDYIYFASGYVKSDDLGDTISNIKGTVGNGGLYRGKLVETTTGEGEAAVVTQTIDEIELMVSKVVGFEGCGLYIFKDKIYFASPTIAQDSTGVRYDLVTFYYCNLDGSGLTELYQTETFDEDTGIFSMTMIDQKVYLLVYTGAEIIKIEENGTATVMASDVTDAVLPTRENVVNNEENPAVNECFVYYTKDTESENTIDLGDTLYKQDIVVNTETELYQEDYIEIDVISITDNILFYARNNENSDTQSYYSNTLGSEVFVNSESRHTMSTYADFVALGEKDGTNLGIAFIYNSKLYVRSLSQGINEVKELVSASSILCVKDGYVYYVYSSDIYRVDVTATDPEPEEISDDLTPLTDIFDVDSDYCYFFVEDSTVDSGYSLYRIALDGLSETNSEAEKIA